MKTFAQLDLDNKGDYLRMLSAVSKLSGLFSESSIPFINYRVAENIFCKSFNAENLSRSDIAYDAKINKIGIGIKTFICSSNHSLEKVAEFNSRSSELTNIKSEVLAYKLAEFRNERINLANRLYNIDESIYHIIARKDKQLVFYDTDYSPIELDKISKVIVTKAGVKFSDGVNDYSFNRSKSTLYRKFHIPPNAIFQQIEILKDPFEILLELLEDKKELLEDEKLIPGIDYIILPLYGYEKKEKFVFENSGLNQWHAQGRVRHPNEVYIPVPSIIHHEFPNFFPPIIKGNKKYFNLHLPNGESFEASMCQTAKIKIDGKLVNKGKGLMTSSNKGLGKWILRDALQLKEKQLVTYEMLESIGFDSVIIRKINENNYKIDVMPVSAFEKFIDNIS